MTAPTYAVVTPARDERDNLARLARSLAAQTLPPMQWVIVDDGSTDGTAELAGELAAAHPWVTVVVAPPAGGSIAVGRRTGRVLAAFRAGCERLAAAPDVVVKLDADVSVPPEHFATLLARFAADPRLAIASGVCHELEDGAWVPRAKTPHSPWGAARAYRADALGVLDGLEDAMGWDGIDELRAHLQGRTTDAFADLPFHHHRLEGARDDGRLRARASQGRASWYMGYRPSYLALRALHHLRRDPTAVAMLFGYTAAAVRRAPRCPDPQVVRLLRDRQRLRRALRGGYAS